MTGSVKSHTRVIVVVRGGVVSTVGSSDPTISVSVLDYDHYEDGPMSPGDEALDEEVERLHPVY